MKRLIRIAPFLIVLSLGVEFFPRVQAIEFNRQSVQEPTKKMNDAKFTGFMILPNYTEQLLYSEAMIYSETYAPEKIPFSKIDQPANSYQQSFANCDQETRNDDQFYTINEKQKKCCSSRSSVNQ